MFLTLLQVASGGAIGASLRYLANVAGGRMGLGPWMTMGVNIAGSAAMGVLFVMLAAKGGHRFSPFLLTGVLGGFTTFSAFSLDTLALWERGDTGAALVYVLGTVTLSLLAVMAGVAAARGFIA